MSNKWFRRCMETNIWMFYALLKYNTATTCSPMKCVILWNLHFQLKFALFDDFGHFIQENKKTEHFSIFSTQKCFSWKWDRI